MLRSIPATNLQLNAQLHAAGFTADEIKAIGETYLTVAGLTYRLFRGNGKPFVAHLTGVAGIVAWDSRDILLIRAALAHSCKTYAKFPPLIRFRRKQDDFLRQHLGDEVYEIISRFKAADRDSTLSVIAAQATVDDAVSRDLVHLKLADVLDDLNDEFGMVGTRKSLFAAPGDVETISACESVARKIGAPRLAGAFGQLANMLPVAPVTNSEFTGSYDMKRIFARLRL